MSLGGFAHENQKGATKQLVAHECYSSTRICLGFLMAQLVQAVF